MRKPTIYIVLMFFASNAYAYDLSTYVTTFGWHKKWQKVLPKATDKYIERIKSSRMKHLSKSEKRRQSENLRAYLISSLNWDAVGTKVVDNMLTSCGKKLLDKMVDYYSGMEFSPDQQKKLRTSYTRCAKTGINASVRMISDAFVNYKKDTKIDNTHGKLQGVSSIIRKKARDSYQKKYIKASAHKAFAQSDNGNWGWRVNRTSRNHAINSALSVCRSHNITFEKTKPCKVINVDGEWTDIVKKQLDFPENMARENILIVTNKALESFKTKYKRKTSHKAFAHSDTGAWSWKSSNISREEAIAKALSACQKNNHKHEKVYPCQLINVNGEWVDY